MAINQSYVLTGPSSLYQGGLIGSYGLHESTLPCRMPPVRRSHWAARLITGEHSTVHGMYTVRYAVYSFTTHPITALLPHVLSTR